jgi:hypothetical protein
MTENLQINEAEQWISHEDEICHADRVERLRWLASKLPRAQYSTFPGGLMAKFIFEETRYCFAYGQYLAVIVLGLAFIERTLAVEFYAAGRNDLERSSFSKLLREAQNARWLSEEEYQAFDRARKIRNPVTHFRHPGHHENIEHRMEEENEYPYTMIEQDARTIAAAVMHMVGRNAV